MAQVTGAGRGVVQETLLEFEVICRDGTMFTDERGQFLFTLARATLLSRSTGGKLWKMAHTPYSSPASFSLQQRTFFLACKCPYLVRIAASARRLALCGNPTAPRADYGYCDKHKGKLLEACPISRVLTAAELAACFRKHAGDPLTP